MADSSSTTREKDENKNMPLISPKTNNKQSVRPKKATHFGKANPKRDACLFFAFLSFMFLVSYLFQETGEPSKTNLLPKLPSLSDMRQVQKAMQQKFEQGQAFGFAPPDTEECSVLLGRSSIPLAGWGVYASKRFSVGEAIFEDWPLSLNDIGLTESNVNNHATESILKFPTYSLLLKPHSLLNNSAWSYENPAFPQLVSTKPITSGEEIFVPWSDHLYNAFPELFSTMPTIHHFQRADSIIKETQQIFKTDSVLSSLPKRRVPDVNKGLLVLRKGLDRYDRTTASLLPLTANDLLLYNDNNASSSELNALRQPSLSSLLRASRCLSDIEWKRGKANVTKQSSSELAHEALPVLSTKKIEEGDLIMPVPLLFHRVEGDSEKYVEVDTVDTEAGQVCSFSDDSLASLLPSSLSPNAFCATLKSFDGRVLNYSLCPLNGFVERTANLHQANARYQWSKNSEKHKTFLNNLRNTSLSKDYIMEDPLAISWDLVATRTIDEGEVIRTFAADEAASVSS